MSNNWLLEDNEDVNGNWLLSEQEPEAEYNGVRTGLATFLEGAVGAGDELDALISRISGDASSWDEAIEGSRARMKSFADNNENLSTALEWGGMAAGFLIPGAAIAKTGQALTKAQQAARLMKYGAAEGAAYGALSGEGEEGRLSGAALGAGLGAGGGYLSSRLLTRNADDIARIDADEAANRVTTGGHIWGDEGVDAAITAKKGKTGSGDFSTSTKTRKVKDVKQNGDTEVGTDSLWSKMGDSFDSTTLGTKEWLTKNGNARAARLLTDSELLIKQSSREIDDIFDEDLAQAMRIIEDIPEAKTLLTNIGQKVKDADGKVVRDVNGKKVRHKMGDLSRFGRTAEEADALKKLQSSYEDIIATDLPGFRKQGREWFPRLAKGRIKNKTNAGIKQYESPVLALKNYAKDVNEARMVAQRFGLTAEELAKIEPKKKGGGTNTRLEAVIDAVEKKAKKELAGKGSDAATNEAAEAAANNLGVALRASLIHSKQGGDSLGSIARKVVSTGLLANPANAMLNVIEGVSLPLYQSGVKGWSAAVVPGMVATVRRKAAASDPNWISTHEFGLDRQFMGEVQAEGQNQVGKLVDKASGWLYKWSGVQTVNEMGQEMASNSAFKRGVQLAKDGSEKAMKELAEMPGMRGLSKDEVKRTAVALSRGDATDPMVRLFAGNTLADVQPVLASSMPKAFNENPNGRVFYSMLSYMNRQYNRIRADVGEELMKAQKAGLNTKEGQEALKKASINGTKYVALLGLVNGVWDDFRKSVSNADDREALFGDGEVRGAEIADLEELLGYLGETTTNQLFSNVSSGVINQRAREYGGDPVEVMPAPIQAGFKLGGGLFDLVTEEEVEDKTKGLMRFGQSYVPGLSQADKLTRAMSGNRLFEDLGLLD